MLFNDANELLGLSEGGREGSAVHLGDDDNYNYSY